MGAEQGHQGQRAWPHLGRRRGQVRGGALAVRAPHPSCSRPTPQLFAPHTPAVRAPHPSCSLLAQRGPAARRNTRAQVTVGLQCGHERPFRELSPVRGPKIRSKNASLDLNLARTVGEPALSHGKACPWRRDSMKKKAGAATEERATCSRDLPTEPAVLSCWRKKKPACSTTTTSAPSTSCSGSSTRAKASPRRLSRASESHSKASASRSKRSSGRASRRRPGIFLSRPARRRSSSFRFAKLFNLVTTTSVPSTS